MRGIGRLGVLFIAVALVTGGVVGAAPLAARAQGAPFQVGAAVMSYAPPCGVDTIASATLRATVNCQLPPAGFTDPADCQPALNSTFNGPRLFAFEEPYIDQQADHHYDLGDPYIDCNADGRWDGNLIGGGSDSPRFYDHVADPPGARAVVIGNGTRTIAIEVLDHEGAFNIFLDAIRSAVSSQLPSLGGSAPCGGLASKDIYISSTHDESAPDSLGLYGVSAATSSSNAYWITYFEAQAAAAVVAACRAMQPAEITYAQAIEPANLRQCFSSYPFVDDELMPAFTARNASTGRTIVTLADVSQHTETLGFNGGPAHDPPSDATAPTLDHEKDWLSADWPYWFRTNLESTLGGIGIEMAGSVGSNETPQVFSQPLSGTPQKFVDASHPAGCRTTWNSAGTMVPLGYFSESKSLGYGLAGAVEGALASGTPSASNVIDGRRADICVTVTNAIFAVGGILGIFAERPSYDPTCTVPAPVPPTGNTFATNIKSTVAAFRVGDGTFVSIPGEVFPFTYLRSFLGPADMPCPDPSSSGDCGGPPNPQVTCTSSGNPYALPPWLMPHMHTPYRFIDGLGEDMIGYIFPCGNGVGVPGEYPVSNPSADSTDRFGCGHSDDSEAAGSSTADTVGTAAVAALDAIGGTAEDVKIGRYVLPGGAVSRDPLGTPPSIGCTTNLTFNATGPAVAVELQDGTVLTPAAWMDLGGRSQTVPDRNTRGYVDAAGVRHWLDVFPNAGFGAPVSVPGSSNGTGTPNTAAPRRPAPPLLPLALLAGGAAIALRRLIPYKSLRGFR